MGVVIWESGIGRWGDPFGLNIESLFYLAFWLEEMSLWLSPHGGKPTVLEAKAD
ncbi:MAG: hypothetical protein HN736_15575 [Anaerolineae bacterium]|nr:hypothetical protein [Anaerolineae bacterium]MBT3714618.1 hypothetical protein [Anaerolineae bacterium]MBT4311082.1 hypothetical protein [Anaerolineae bacterium]MBT4458333.1 hypothetical protein [Anaerolineae bacterium]MBT4842770.1 hypothetical protein [Anaerolineae bacterium]